MQEQQKPLFHTPPNEIPPLLPGVPPGKLLPLPPPPPPGTDAATGQPSANVPGATRAPANKPPEPQPQPGVLTIPPGTTTIPPAGTPVPDTLAIPASSAPPPPNDSGTPPQGKP
jgi:hypothetical protein